MDQGDLFCFLDEVSTGQIFSDLPTPLKRDMIKLIQQQEWNFNKMKLLQANKIGSLTLKNSMAMAPMTCSCADLNGKVTDLTVLYYTQRASAGLVLSEGINISKQAVGSLRLPTKLTDDQATKNLLSRLSNKGQNNYR